MRGEPADLLALRQQFEMLAAERRPMLPMTPWSEGGQSGDLRGTRLAQHGGADPQPITGAVRRKLSAFDTQTGRRGRGASRR
jgi:hypothetical protein